MALTKATISKKPAEVKAVEKPAASKPLATDKVASKTTADHSIRTEDSAIRVVSTFAPAETSPELRRDMIRAAAYFRAESRGFAGGDPLQDWKEAEAEIDQMLGWKSTPQP